VEINKQAVKGMLDRIDNLERQIAWELYCKDTQGDPSTRVDWKSLPEYVRSIYLEKAKVFNGINND